MNSPPAVPCQDHAAERLYRFPKALFGAPYEPPIRLFAITVSLSHWDCLGMSPGRMPPVGSFLVS
jgi:hypothetical protein